MKYRKLGKYKYETVEDVQIATRLRPVETIATAYGMLTPNGTAVIYKGYAWDGASGPTIDTKSSMVASLVHDFLYQLIREGYLQKSDRKPADLTLYDLLIEHGMWKWRAKMWYQGVRKGAWWAATPTDKPQDKIYTAP